MATRPVLSFANVVKRCWDGGRELLVLDGVSFDVEAGAFVGLYGARRSGKSTLLQLAAGITPPDEGYISVEGHDLTRISSAARARLMRGTVGFVAADTWRPAGRETVVDYLVLSLGCDGLTVAQARRRAYRALDEVGLAGTGLEPTVALPMVERVSLLLARALLHEPRLLLVDEPALIPSLDGRERFATLLASVARQRDMAVIVASEELAALQGASVMMSIGSGELTSTDERGVLVRFPGRGRVAGERPAL